MKGDLKISIHGNSSLNPKVNVNFGGTEESGHPHSRRRQNKGNNKSHSSNKQRFFHSNSRNHNNGRSYQGIVSESPPVGFFFGSTPPNNNGLVLCSIMFMYTMVAVIVVSGVWFYAIVFHAQCVLLIFFLFSLNFVALHCRN